MQKNTFIHLDKIIMLVKIAKELEAEQLLTADLLGKLDAAISVFGANKSHAEHFQKLPTKKLKCFELLIWGSSYANDSKEFTQLKKLLEPKLTRQEWDYLIDSTPSIMAKIGYSQLKKEYLGM